MNNRLWLFYPENDIALAHGGANFTAPPAAVKLRRSGEVLPIWMADADDRVSCNGVNERWLNEVTTAFGLKADVWNHEDFNLAPTPWGWSEASKRVFEKNGFSPNTLPTSETLAKYRMMSHRRTAAEISRRVAASVNFPIWPAAVEVSAREILHDMLRNRPMVVKAPWSSSGRGVTFVETAHCDSAIQRLEGTIRKQGSVMVEEYAPGHFDFAMLFSCENGCVTYRGLSIFATDAATGQYRGNVVDTQDNLEAILSKRLECGKTESLRRALAEAIEAIIAPEYDGPVGIDLFVTEQNGLRLVHVVESNLRWTMGFVALGLARYVNNQAVFEIIPGDISASCKPVVHNGKLSSGSLALTPPGGDFTFILKIENHT